MDGYLIGSNFQTFDKMNVSLEIGNAVSTSKIPHLYYFVVSTRNNHAIIHIQTIDSRGVSYVCVFIFIDTYIGDWLMGDLENERENGRGYYLERYEQICLFPGPTI